MTNVSPDTIVVGTSSGGLAALIKLLGGLPGELNASVLIVLHTPPGSPRLLATILGRCTKLKVAYGGTDIPSNQGMSTSRLLTTI